MHGVRIPYGFILVVLMGFTALSRGNAYADKIIADSLKRELTRAAGKAQIESLQQLTSQLWSYNTDDAMRCARLAYKLSSKRYDSLNMALALKNIGIICYFTGEFEEALENYQQALKIYTKLSYKKGISGCFNNIGIVYNDWGSYDSALYYYNHSLEIDLQLNDKMNSGKTYHNIGKIYHLKGWYDKAIFYYKKSLEIEVEFNNPDGIGESLHNIGSVFQEIDLNKQSMVCYETAKVLYKKTGNEYRMAQLYHDIAKVFYVEGNYWASYQYTIHALKLNEKLHNKQGIASAYNLLGIIYEAIGETSRANDYLFRAVLLDSELGNNKKISIDLTNQGKMHFKAEEFEQAKGFFLNSLEYALEIEAWPEMLENYEYLSETYFNLNDSAKGLYYNELYQILADSMKNEASTFNLNKGDHQANALYAGLGEKFFNNDGEEKTYESYNSVIISAIFIVFMIVFIFLLTQKKTPNNNI